MACLVDGAELVHSAPCRSLKAICAFLSIFLHLRVLKAQPSKLQLGDFSELT